MTQLLFLCKTSVLATGDDHTQEIELRSATMGPTDDNDTVHDSDVESDLVKSMTLIQVVMSGMQLPAYKTSQKLGQAPRGIIYIIGLTGNFISGLVMFQKKNRQISCYFYMGVLAILDSMPILASIPYWILNDLLTMSMTQDTHKVFCPAMWTFMAANILSGTYIVMAMTFDRLVAVRWPLKAVTWCSMKRAKVTSAIIILSCYVFRLPYILWTDTVPPAKCAAFQGEQSKIELVYYYVNLLVGCYIPFCFLLACNVTIIITLNRRGKYFEKDRGSDSSNIATSQQTLENITTTTARSTGTTMRKPEVSTTDKQQKSQLSLSIMLLMVSFTFLLFTSPLYIFYLIYAFRSYLDSPETYAIFNLAMVNVYNIFQLNHCVNFYLYCLSGTKFRRDLKETMKNICSR